MQELGGVDAIFDPLGFESFDESYSVLIVAPDGKRIVAAPRPEAARQKGSAHITVLVNFLDELRRRFPEVK